MAINNAVRRVIVIHIMRRKGKLFISINFSNLLNVITHVLKGWWQTFCLQYCVGHLRWLGHRFMIGIPWQMRLWRHNSVLQGGGPGVVARPVAAPADAQRGRRPHCTRALYSPHSTLHCMRYYKYLYRKRLLFHPFRYCWCFYIICIFMSIVFLVIARDLMFVPF